MASWHTRTLGLTLCLTAAAAVAQDNDGPPPNPSLTATANGIRDAKHARDIRMKRLDVAVELRGAVAETTVTAAFASEAKEPLEGEFKLQLPADAVITGYALDIGGRMTDGVLVDRPKAKAVYEARVRQRVDPGLAEVSAGNVFSTRVFPITPNAGRTVRVKYVSAAGRDGAIRMPLAGAAPTQGWSISIKALGTTAPQLTLPSGGSDFAPVAGGFSTLASGTSSLTGEIVIRPALTRDLLISRHRNGERYVQIGGALPAVAAKQAESVRIYWDRSRSRLDDRLDAEIKLVRDYLATANARSIELVAFNSSGAKRTIVATADAAATVLRGLSYRGATSFASIAKDAAVDRCLVFSDGQVTIDRAAGFAPHCRVDTVTSANDADNGWLGHLAASGGGHNLTLGENNRSALLADLRASGSGVVGVEGATGGALAFVPLAAPAGEWRVLARAPDTGDVTVRLSDGSTLRRAVTGDEAAFDGEGALIARDQLSLLGATERRLDFIALSRKFGIASPSLSFVVLETPQDYVTAEVAPPTNYAPEELAKYAALKRDDDRQKDDRRQERLGEVVELWNAEVKWWKTPFNPYAKTARDQDDDRGVPPPAPVVAPAPPPMEMPPPPPPPAPAPSTNSVQDRLRELPAARSPSADGAIVVTGSRIGSGRGRPGPDGAIAIDAWQPDRPYLKSFDAAPAKFDGVFAREEKKSGSIPAFYLDTAEWLRKHNRKADAIEMVLGAIDLTVANEVTIGVVADRLERYGAIDRAIELRERHAALDPERPQPKRYLALALARRAALGGAGARADYKRAIGLLRDIALTPWADAWDGIEVIALVEANAMIPKLRALGGAPDLDKRLITLLDTDLRVTIDWTTDATDIDLWVDEPNGERSIYSNPLTRIGGRLSNDMTNGYGPEQYLLRRAPGGTFTVRANVYASDTIDPNGASVMTAHLYRNYGRPNQSEEVVDIELVRGADGRGNDNERMIGRIVVRR